MRREKNELACIKIPSIMIRRFITFEVIHEQKLTLKCGRLWSQGSEHFVAMFNTKEFINDLATKCMLPFFSR